MRPVPENWHGVGRGPGVDRALDRAQRATDPVPGQRAGTSSRAADPVLPRALRHRRRVPRDVGVDDAASAPGGRGARSRGKRRAALGVHGGGARRGPRGGPRRGRDRSAPSRHLLEGHDLGPRPGAGEALPYRLHGHRRLPRGGGGSSPDVRRHAVGDTISGATDERSAPEARAARRLRRHRSRETSGATSRSCADRFWWRAGGPGSILDDEAVDRYLAVRPDAEIVVVPDAPHDVFRPDPLFFPKVVAAFADRVEALAQRE